MIKQVELKLLPKEAHDNELIKKLVLRKLDLHQDDIDEIVKVKESIDARERPVKFVLLLDVYINEKYQKPQEIKSYYKKSDSNKSVIIVGAGPAGYFAALELIENGIKPIIFERGKDVKERRYDLRNIQQLGIVNPHSNYCFGEGGAGTYSDGKLYTRSTKRGDVKKVLRIFVEHGAKDEILVEAHPHIGSNKLPIIVSNMRETILEYGGEVHFNSYVTDLIVKDEEIKGVVVNGEKEYFADSVILATGHSARDIFELLDRKKIYIEMKPFAIGVRAEHKQILIDGVQYGESPRNEYLPASSYKLITQVENRGVFSFCMCPGGFIVPSATAPGELVLNGMSLSKRDSKYANSGIVVSVEKEDLKDYQKYGALAGLMFQKDVERKMFEAGGGVTQKAPAQRLKDFVQGKISDSLPDTSYVPGIVSSPLHEILPPNIANRLRTAFIDFGKKIKGYYTEDANIIAVESRTSSPVKIPRDNTTLMHVQIKNLYPCGEGAGYAGGIVSAAIDGQNCAKAIVKNIKA
jgi:uncharacterized FAD-dependent dehydrogenase